MYKQFTFQPAEFSSYLRARMSERMEELNDHWNRARNSVEHDSKSSNFNVVQTFITQVSDVYFDFYPEPFVLPTTELKQTKKDSDKYLQMRLRQIPINMFEDIFQQANFEDRPLMWHTYLYLTDTRHARVRNYYRKDEYDLPVDDNVAKKEIKKDTIKWKNADKSLMRQEEPKPSKKMNFASTVVKIMQRDEWKKGEWLEYDYLLKAVSQLPEVKNSSLKIYLDGVKKKAEEQITEEEYNSRAFSSNNLNVLPIDIRQKVKKQKVKQEKIRTEAIGKYNEIVESFLQRKQIADTDKVLFQEFVKDQKETATLEGQRIQHRILPPVETDPSSFKKESKQHFPGTFLYNAVRGKFNYSFEDAFQGKSGIYDDMKKTDDVMWKFLNINNESKSKIFSKETIGKYQAVVNNAWSTANGTVKVQRCTIEDKGYATFPLAATLNNLSTLDIKNGDKDDFEYRAQFKRFLYLNNTFAHNTFYYIEKSSILLKVIMGYILGLSNDTLKLITECDARITFQDLIVERTSTKSALTISDEQKEKKKQQIQFKKISNILWKCEDPKWPLQYLGAIDFHKLESIYEFEAKENKFNDLDKFLEILFQDIRLVGKELENEHGEDYRNIFVEAFVDWFDDQLEDPIKKYIDVNLIQLYLKVLKEKSE